jgi:predicted nucleotidyltransferase
MESKLEKYKKIIMPIIERHVPNAKIILYGSRARGDFEEGADINIALDMGEKIDSWLIYPIMLNLEDSNLPIFFSVVDFAKVSEEFRKNILKDGIMWKEQTN